MWFKNRIHFASISILIILAIFGPYFDGLVFSGMHFFPFIIYLVFIHIPITAILVFNKSDINLNRIDVYLILIVIYATLSVGWASDHNAAIKTIGVFVPTVLITLLISIIGKGDYSGQTLLSLLKKFTLFVLFIALFSLVSNIDILGLQWFGDRYMSRGWYTNRNNLSYFFSLLTPFFLIGALEYSKRYLTRFVDLLAYFGSLVIIHFNGSRAALFSQLLVLLTVVSLVIWNKETWFQGSRFQTYSINRPFTLLLLALIPSLMIIFSVVANPFIIDNNFSLAVRWNLHKGAYMMAYDNLLGVGIGNFSGAFLETGLEPGQINSHSWFASFIGEFGLIGIVLFILFYGGLLDILYDRCINGGNSYDIALFASIVSFSFAGLGPSSPLLLQMHWVLFGVALIYIKSSTHQSKNGGNTSLESVPHKAS